MIILSLLLKKLYTKRSLKNAGGGAQFAIKNRLGDAEVVGIGSLAIDGRLVALDRVRLDLADGRVLNAGQVDGAHPIPFPLSSMITVHTGEPELCLGPHEIDVAFEARPSGQLKFNVEDTISEDGQPQTHIPRDETDDYTPEIIGR